MKKTMNWAFLGAVAIGFAFTLGAKTKVLSGSTDVLKENKSVYVEFKMDNSSIDALDSESAFVAYKTSKHKDPKQWEKDWTKDKAEFSNYYTEALGKVMKKMPLSFNNDNPNSDYKMVVDLMHMETGNPMKYSSVECKLIFTETTTNKEVLQLYMPRSRGAQMGPSTPTVGMRIKIALYGSAKIFQGFYKKEIK